jgi:hypothetical protein
MNPEREITTTVPNPHEKAFLTTERNLLIGDPTLDPERRTGQLADARNAYAQAKCQARSLFRNNPLVNFVNRSRGQLDANQRLEVARLNYEGGVDTNGITTDPATNNRRPAGARVGGLLPRYIELEARRRVDNVTTNTEATPLRDDIYRQEVACQAAQIAIQEHRDLVRAQVEGTHGLRFNPLLESAIGWGLNAGIGVSALTGALPLTGALIAARVALGTRANERLFRGVEDFVSGRVGARRDRDVHEIFGAGPRAGMTMAEVDQAIADHADYMVRRGNNAENNTYRNLLLRKQQLTTEQIQRALEAQVDAHGQPIVRNWKRNMGLAALEEQNVSDAQAEMARHNINLQGEQQNLNDTQAEMAQAEMRRQAADRARTAARTERDEAVRLRDLAQDAMDEADRLRGQATTERTTAEAARDAAQARIDAADEVLDANPAHDPRGRGNASGAIYNLDQYPDVMRICQEYNDNRVEITRLRALPRLSVAERTEIIRRENRNYDLRGELMPMVTDVDTVVDAFGNRVVAEDEWTNADTEVTRADGEITRQTEEFNRAQTAVNAEDTRAQNAQREYVNQDRAVAAAFVEVQAREQDVNDAQAEMARHNGLMADEEQNMNDAQAEAARHHQLTEQQAILVHDLLLGTPAGATKLAKDGAGNDLNVPNGILRENRLNRETEETMKNQRRNAVLRNALALPLAALLTWMTLPQTEVLHFAGNDPIFNNFSSLKGQSEAAAYQAFHLSNPGATFDLTTEAGADAWRNFLYNDPRMADMASRLPEYQQWIQINNPDAFANLNNQPFRDLLHHTMHTPGEILAPDPAQWFLGNPRLPKFPLPQIPFPTFYFHPDNNVISPLGINLNRIS